MTLERWNKGLSNCDEQFICNETTSKRAFQFDPGVIIELVESYERTITTIIDLFLMKITNRFALNRN